MPRNTAGLPSRQAPDLATDDLDQLTILHREFDDPMSDGRDGSPEQRHYDKKETLAQKYLDLFNLSFLF